VFSLSYLPLRLIYCSSLVPSCLSFIKKSSNLYQHVGHTLTTPTDLQLRGRSINDTYRSPAKGAEHPTSGLTLSLSSVLLKLLTDLWRLITTESRFIRMWSILWSGRSSPLLPYWIQEKFLFSSTVHSSPLPLATIFFHWSGFGSNFVQCSFLQSIAPTDKLSWLEKRWQICYNYVSPQKPPQTPLRLWIAFKRTFCKSLVLFEIIIIFEFYVINSLIFRISWHFHQNVQKIAIRHTDSLYIYLIWLTRTVSSLLTITCDNMLTPATTSRSNTAFQTVNNSLSTITVRLVCENWKCIHSLYICYCLWGGGRGDGIMRGRGDGITYENL